jgi:hypothetical protein
VATKASTSSTRLLAIGALVLVVGVILVLLVLRGNVGGPPAAAPDPGAVDPPADVAPASAVDAEGAATAPEVTPTTVEELAAVRLPLPASVPDGMEGIAVRASFVRGLAALPTPGDRVNLYHAAQDEAATAEPVDVDPDLAGVEEGPRLLLEDLEVLALVGPLPTQNEGEVTFLVAVDPADVPALLPVAGTGDVWFTLLPDTTVEDEA